MSSHRGVGGGGVRKNGGGGGGGGGGLDSLPISPRSRKIVERVKEVVMDFPDAEIYAALKECDMDADLATTRLLSQDHFHEVKSKREKKKETKDTTEPRVRGSNSTSNRGARSGTDRYATRGLPQFSSAESGGLSGKPTYKKENGTGPYTSSSASFYGMTESYASRLPPAPSDSTVFEHNMSSVTPVNDPYVTPQTSGYQAAWSGVSGQKSMADIVKMGKLHNKASNTPHSLVTAPPSAEEWTMDQHVSTEDEWPRDEYVPTDTEWPPMEQSQVGVMAPVVETHADFESYPDTSNWQFDRVHTNEVQEVDDCAIKDHVNNQVEADSISGSKAQETYSESVENICTYHSHDYGFEHQEVEDVNVSVSSLHANLEQLSMQDDAHRIQPEEDCPSLVIPDHLQVQAADCSHLSFGNFGPGMASVLPGPLLSIKSRNNSDEAPVDAGDSLSAHSDARNAEYYGDDSIRTSDGELVNRTAASAGNYELPSASQPESSKQENPEVTHGSQHTFSSSTPNYSFENPHILNSSYSHSQRGLELQRPPFPSVTPAYTSSLSSTLLAAQGHPVRESDMSYSPFRITQSTPAKYGNSLSSSSGPTISMTEALKAGGFLSSQYTQQTLPRNTVETGLTHPQQLATNPYSQLNIPLESYPSMPGYSYLPPSYTQMPSGFHQVLSGNSTYHQPQSDSLAQYKGSVSVSSLPQSAAVASAYGPFGATAFSGNYQMRPPAGSAIGYEDVLSTQYKDNSHLLALQQNENAAMYVHGAGSRTLSAVPSGTLYGAQNQQQSPSGFHLDQQPSYGLAYQNLHHLRWQNQQRATQVSLDQQQLQNLREGALFGSQVQPKSSANMWQNTY